LNALAAVRSPLIQIGEADGKILHVPVGIPDAAQVDNAIKRRNEHQNKRRREKQRILFVESKFTPGGFQQGRHDHFPISKRIAL
jgi:hypothetical protein